MVEEAIRQLRKLRDKQDGYGYSLKTNTSRYGGRAEANLYGDKASAAIWLMNNADAVIDLISRPSPPLSDDAAALVKGPLSYSDMGSGGRCDWQQLREAVAEARMGRRDLAEPESITIYPGHMAVKGINYNSLDRIVTAFVDAAMITRLAAPRPVGEGLVEVVAREALDRMVALDEEIEAENPGWMDGTLTVKPNRVEPSCDECGAFSGHSHRPDCAALRSLPSRDEDQGDGR